MQIKSFSETLKHGLLCPLCLTDVAPQRKSTENLHDDI